MEYAKFIGVKESVESFAIKKTFNYECGRVTLECTALGVYFAVLNGKRVGRDYLSPGWTAYDKTLQVQTYDVTDLLVAGNNEITVFVGGGWFYRQPTYPHYSYGDKIAALAELTFENGKRIVTDETWIASESFIRSSSIYDGEIQDFTAERRPLTPIEIPYDKSVLVGQICEPVRNIERLKVKEKILTPRGEIVYDFGQNIAGVVEIKTPKGFKGKIELRFAEILDEGNFYTENLRKAKCTDVFIVKEEGVYSPEFTYHGFRYAQIIGVDLDSDSVVAVVRHTDMKRIGYVTTDNARFNRLVDNAVWGLRGNFVDIPTDCPQRDERMGWTGDVNAFCGTAAFSYDVRGILRKWLADLRNGQSETGEIPRIAPDVWGNKATSAFWADAISMIPWTLYRIYGDASFLSENYAAMKKFVAARENTMTDGLIVRGFEFGDWLAMDNEPLLVGEFRGRTDLYYIVNVFHAVTLQIVSDTAAVLGKTQESELYRRKRESLLAAIRKEYFTLSGRLCFDTVTAQVIALHFGIVEDKYRDKLAAELNANVVKRKYCVTTGFIGTPFLLFALADNGYFETAKKVLFNDKCPGWLFEVDTGATTIWERWNSALPNGKPNPDASMNSYNHYAYGSVIEFVWRRIAGIEPLSAGFATVSVKPRPCAELSEMRAEYDSVKGKIVSEYKRVGDKIIYNFEIPENTQAEIKLPNEDAVSLSSGKYSFERD